MAKHANNSSNLAALCLHVSRMVREVHAATGSLTDKIALVGKARATAGSLRLLRILIHDVPPDQMADSLLYRSRVDRDVDKSAGTELVTCLFNYLCSANLALDVSELYDTTVAALELLLVLLSTSQLYQPMMSSMERKQQSVNLNYYILDYIMEDAQRRRQHRHSTETSQSTWTPQTFLQTCLGWQLHRPAAPIRSIAHHNAQLLESVIAVKGDKVGPDGMYENHVVVMAQTPKPKEAGSDHDASQSTALARRSSGSILFDATKGVLVLSSSLILLPFRLVTLALGLLGRGKKGPEYDQLKKQHLQAKNRRTNDVLWLTQSPIADLSTTLFLLLAHNHRAGSNPFRSELAALNDNRWDEMRQLATDAKSEDENSTMVSLLQETKFSANFEALFESLGTIMHTEVGSLLLYTMYQASPSFCTSLSVRSDLDTLVVPLLRTLYFSSSLRHFTGNTVSSPKNHTALSARNCPFRSPSQLYLNLILLLLFSQDTSFGPDVFRRVIVTSVPWYRERNLKEITLGSLLVLTVLRSISFNLNRLQDAFLLSNCCAVLMNLSPHVVQLHEYTAMRLVSVTISSIKKYSTLVARNGDGAQDEEDLTSPLGMYSEVSRTLLGLLRHCLSPKNLDKNLNLVYALVYNQTEFKELVGKVTLKSLKADMVRVEKVIRTADQIVHDDGTARTASKALSVLESNMDKLKEVSEKNQEADFTFSYEEEADPEIFFVPYVWEVAVSVVTASTIDWDTHRIQVFPLLEEDENEDFLDNGAEEEQELKGFATDVSDVV